MKREGKGQKIEGQKEIDGRGRERGEDRQSDALKQMFTTVYWCVKGWFPFAGAGGCK